MEAAESVFKQAFAYPFRPSLFRRGDALGLAAVPLYALGSGSAVHGALYMLAFSLGTLPNLLAMGIFAAQLKTLLQKRSIRLLAGLMVAAWALWRLWVSVSGWTA